MSPEQAMGEREIDGRSDLYSLSVVGFQMITGELPFQASNTPSMLMKHLSERPKPIATLRPDAPAALAAVIERGMAKKPADRFSNASEFRDALVAAEQGTAPVSRASASVAEPMPEHPSGPWKRPALRPTASHEDPRDASVGSPRVGVVGRLANPDRTPDERERLAREEYSNDRRSALDAIEASNIGMRPANSLPPIPAFMPATWKEARNEWRMNRRQWREARRSYFEGGQVPGGRTDEERIRAFRRRTASTVVTVGVLATINMATASHAPWFLFPTAFLSLGLLRNAAKLWADGISFRRVFGRGAREELAKGRATPAAPQKSLGDLAAKLAPADVLAGHWGDVVRRAASDRAAVHDAIGRLAPADRNLIPDVAPTVDALAERVGSIAQALHRMDEDITPAQIADLERRLATTRAQPESAERDQRIQLLERQQATLADLGRRRQTLQVQIESASLMLQNMRLDLLALRSVGVQSAIDDVSSATQEARALSKEIANVLDAAREIR
jgi:serine/threonine-protein kinase